MKRRGTGPRDRDWSFYLAIQQVDAGYVHDSPADLVDYLVCHSDADQIWLEGAIFRKLERGDQ